MADEPRVIGWCKTTKAGICVDPHHKGAHMAQGGVTPVSRQGDDTPHRA
jgi:hypothetical protein